MKPKLENFFLTQVKQSLSLTQVKSYYYIAIHLAILPMYVDGEGYRRSKKGEPVTEVIGQRTSVEKCRKYLDAIYLWSLIKSLKTTDIVNGLLLGKNEEHYIATLQVS